MKLEAIIRDLVRLENEIKSAINGSDEELLSQVDQQYQMRFNQLLQFDPKLPSDANMLLKYIFEKSLISENQSAVIKKLSDKAIEIIDSFVK